MKSVQNNKNVSIEFNEDFEKVCRKYFNKSENEELTEQEIFKFFYEAYNKAVEKGYKIVEE